MRSSIYYDLTMKTRSENVAESCGCECCSCGRSIKAEPQKPDAKLVSKPRTENPRKRKNDDSGVKKNPAAKKATNTSNQMRKVIIEIVDGDTRIPLTSSKSHNEQNEGISEEQRKLLQRKMDQIKEEIAFFEKVETYLLAKRAAIIRKLKKY